MPMACKSEGKRGTPWENVGDSSYERLMGFEEQMIPMHFF